MKRRSPLAGWPTAAWSDKVAAYAVYAAALDTEEAAASRLQHRLAVAADAQADRPRRTAASPGGRPRRMATPRRFRRCTS
jgi:hypothetical protein